MLLMVFSELPLTLTLKSDREDAETQGDIPGEFEFTGLSSQPSTRAFFSNP